MAYGPKGVAIGTGLVGVLASPNKLVAVLFVVGAGVIDTIATAWSRWYERRRSQP